MTESARERAERIVRRILSGVRELAARASAARVPEGERLLNDAAVERVMD